ncbi:very short patch repair endonuclease [Candidatus Omnitrophota bacterium]
MLDIYSRKKRSNIMSKISGKETKPEIIVRKILFSKGLRFRKNDSRYPGKPDIILPKYKTAIFVHGCFWHGHNCKAGKLPETRKEFWTKKINDTKNRDKKNKSELEADGWKVLTVWNCEINTIIKRNKRLNLLLEEILK